MRKDLLVMASIAVLLGLALGELGFFEAAKWMKGLGNLGTLSSDMFPPDAGVIPIVGKALWETVQMAFAGTILGFLVSLPLGILGTRDLFSKPVSNLSRFIAAGIRTVHVLVWGVLFVILVGLGPLAGTLAVAAYTIGYLAKIYAELFEGTDPEIMEAVRATGASKSQLVRFVVIPEGANAVLTQLLFMLEYNIRGSSVLGFVGAGGIGFVMKVYIDTIEYHRLATVLLLILAVVLIMDGLSAWIRRRFLLTPQP